MENVENNNGFWADEYNYICPNHYGLDIQLMEGAYYSSNFELTMYTQFCVREFYQGSLAECKAKAEEFIAKWERANTNQILEKASIESQFVARMMPKPKDYAPDLEKIKQEIQIETKELFAMLMEGMPKLVMDAINIADFESETLKSALQSFANIDKRLKVLEGGK